LITSAGVRANNTAADNRNLHQKNAFLHDTLLHAELH
jgi:hypothetical protein